MIKETSIDADCARSIQVKPNICYSTPTDIDLANMSGRYQCMMIHGNGIDGWRFKMIRWFLKLFRLRIYLLTITGRFSNIYIESAYGIYR